MTATRGQKDKKDQKHASSGEPGSSPTRRRHWVRWTLAAAATTVLLVLLAVALAIRFRPVPAPLVLPAHTAGQPAGPLAGSWHTAAGSMAGFRVPQTVIGLTSNAVGRTDAVSGAAVIAGDRVVRATFRVDLTTIKVAGTQFAASLRLGRFPVATVTLARPVKFGRGFMTGTAIATRAACLLTMHGLSRPVTATLTARRDRSLLEVAGRLPVAFARWRVRGPAGFWPLASLGDHGTAEFLLVLGHPGARTRR